MSTKKQTTTNKKLTPTQRYKLENANLKEQLSSIKTEFNKSVQHMIPIQQENDQLMATLTHIDNLGHALLFTPGQFQGTEKQVIQALFKNIHLFGTALGYTILANKAIKQ